MSNPNQTCRLGDMTAPGFAAAARLNPVILLPLSSQEDHGPHLPMGDYLLAELLAERVAKAATARGAPTFVAPCLPFGIADYFASSPGSLAISAQSFRSILGELLAGLLRHGFTKIVIFNGHGGNVPVIHDVTLQVKDESGVIIPSFYLWRIARQLMQQRLGPAASPRFGHGGEPLLSLTLALRGDFIAADEGAPHKPCAMLGLSVSDFGTLDFEGVGIEVPTRYDDVPSSAVTAAWEFGSVALGKEIADTLVEVGTKFIIHFDKAGTARS